MYFQDFHHVWVLETHLYKKIIIVRCLVSPKNSTVINNSTNLQYSSFHFSQKTKNFVLCSITSLCTCIWIKLWFLNTRVMLKTNLKLCFVTNECLILSSTTFRFIKINIILGFFTEDNVKSSQMLWFCLKRLLSEDLQEQMRSDCTQVSGMRLLVVYPVP